MSSKNAQLLPKSIRIVRAARQQAVQLKDSHVGTEHLLLALFDSPEAIFEIQRYLTVDVEGVKLTLFKEIEQADEHKKPSATPILSPRFTKVIALSGKIAGSEFSTAYVTPLHLFLGILREGDGMAARILKKGGLTYDSAVSLIPGASSSGTPAEVDMLPGVTQQLHVTKVERLESSNGLTMTVKIIKVNTEPAARIFQTELSNNAACWPETFSTPGELNAYIRGLRSMASMKGDILLWEMEPQFGQL